MTQPHDHAGRRCASRYAPSKAARDDEEAYTEGPGTVPALGLMMIGALSASLGWILFIAIVFA